MTRPLIHEVRIYRIAGFSVGAMLYGDQWAILNLDQKEPLLRKGVVFLHPTSHWADRLEPVKVAAAPEEGIGQDEVYGGAILDDRVARIVQELQELRAGGRVEEDPRFAGAFEEWPDLWGDEG